MQEISIRQNQSAYPKTIFLMNRETGEFILFGGFYRFDFQTNTVFRIENDSLTPVCTGYFENNIWYFKGRGKFEMHKDPFVAAMKILL